MQNQYEKDSSADFAWNVKNVKGRKNDMEKKSNGKRNLFIAVVIAIVFLGIVSIVISGTTMYHFLEKYLEQAAKSGTDVILEESGISGLIDWISEKETVPANILISDLDADLNEKGEVYSFTLSIQEFDDKNEYVKDILYIYDSERKELNVKEDINRITKTQYDPNAEVDYLDSQMKRIPFIAQMKALDFERYKVQYRQDGRLEAGMPVIDGRDQEAFPILTWDEYMQGAGGLSDGGSQVVIALTNGSVIIGECVRYICTPKDAEALPGDSETVMQTDYKFLQDGLFLTDDSGETWISSGLTKEQIESTTEVYGKGNLLPENSIYSDENGMFAVFWGEVPVLHLSKDDGKTWEDIEFAENYPRFCKSRIVRFLDSENGYVGLGTDWSMGTGGATFVGWTHDGGTTWKTTSIPMEGGLILSGLAFADMQNGMLTMDSQFGDNSWPRVFVTNDAGNQFREIEMPWETISEDVTFLNKVDSLTYENGVYHLTLGQGEYGNMKADFTGVSLDGEWTFEKSYIGTIHTTG